MLNNLNPVFKDFTCQGNFAPKPSGALPNGVSYSAPPNATPLNNAPYNTPFYTNPQNQQTPDTFNSKENKDSKKINPKTVAAFAAFFAVTALAIGVFVHNARKGKAKPPKNSSIPQTGNNFTQKTGNIAQTPQNPSATPKALPAPPKTPQNPNNPAPKTTTQTQTFVPKNPTTTQTAPTDNRQTFNIYHVGEKNPSPLYKAFSVDRDYPLAQRLFKEKTGAALHCPTPTDDFGTSLIEFDRLASQGKFPKGIKHVVVGHGLGSSEDGTWRFMNNGRSVFDYIDENIPKGEEVLVIVCEETAHRVQGKPAIGTEVTMNLMNPKHPVKLVRSGEHKIIGHYLSPEVRYPNGIQSGITRY